MMKGEKTLKWEKLKKQNKRNFDDGSMIRIKNRTSKSGARMIFSKSLLAKYNPNAKLVSIYYSEKDSLLGLKFFENESESDCYHLKKESAYYLAINCSLMNRFFPFKYFEKDIGYDSKSNIVFFKVELQKEAKIGREDISSDKFEWKR